MHGLLLYGVEASLNSMITERSGLAKHISTAFMFPGGQDNRPSPNVLAPTRQDVQKPLRNTLPTSTMQDHPRLHDFTVFVQKWTLPSISQCLSRVGQMALCLVVAKTTARTRRNHRSLPRQKTHQGMSAKYIL